MEITFDLTTWSGVIGAMLLAFLLWCLIRWDRKVKQGLRDFAQGAGLSYVGSETGDHPWDQPPESEIAKRFHFLEAIKKSADFKIVNVISGRYRGHDILAFDVKTQEGKSSNEYGICILLLGKGFPRVFVRTKEHLEIGENERLNEVRIDNPAFTLHMSVISSDPALAATFCHPRMCDFLLKQEYVDLQLQGEALAASDVTGWDAEQLKTRLDLLVEVRSLMPISMFVA